jgi:diguanylate cyclase (GGDEF)-like protein
LIYRIYEDRQGTIWLGTREGLNRFDPQTNDFTIFKTDPQNPESIPNKRIWAMYEDRQGNFWVGTRGGGLILMDRASHKFRAFKHDPADPNSISDNNIWNILEDSHGNLWIATETGGLNRLDRQTGKFTAYKNNPNDPYSLSHNDIFWLCEDRSGVLWIASRRGGINKLYPSLQRFTYYHHIPENPATISQNNVTAVWTDAQGYLWVGTEGGGLNRLDRLRQQNKIFRNNLEDKNSLSVDTIYSLYQDEKGILWIGTSGGGLNRLDPKDDSIQVFRFDKEKPDSIASDWLPDIAPAGDGKLWLGTEGYGVDLFDPQTGKATHYHNDPANPDSLGEDTVFALARESSGILWLATGRAGVERFDPKTQKFSHFPHDPNKPNSPAHNMVQALYLDETNRTLWAGTVSGLSRLNLDTLQWKNYTHLDGLSNDTITGVTADKYGMLWISTGKGLSRFDPQKEIFKNFDVNDGLQGSQFNMGSFFRAADGELLFGGTNGLNGFYPENIVDNEFTPPIVLTDFQLFNRSISPPNAPLSAPIDQIERLSLNYDQTVFTFEFAALNYQVSAKNLYQYKMEGFDQDWSPPSTKRTATYTNLDPGEYTFLVKGANNDGVWSDTIRRLPVIIYPPWWGTTWFQFLMVVLVIALIIGGVQWRLNGIQVYNRSLEKRVQQRTIELTQANNQLKHEIEQRHQAEQQLQFQLAEISGLRDQLREQAVRDVLTGLYNRRYLDEMIDRELARAERDQDQVGILMIDIDFFKNFNDTYTHQAGDLVLKAMGEMLLKQTRRADIACRFGGEEFVVIMPGAALDECLERAEMLRASFQSTTITFEGQKLSATISIGVSVYPQHAQNSDTLIGLADSALYKAKRAGRNRVESA